MYNLVMSIAAVMQLLQTALLLLTLAQVPNLSPALKTQATAMANQAIAVATQTLASASNNNITSPSIVSAPAVIAPSPTVVPPAVRTNVPQTPSTYQQVGMALAFSPVGAYASQYSPWVMREPGWGNYLMYYCKNTEVNGVFRDRVWRAENWGDGKAGWINDQVVLEATSTSSEEDLACSPSVAINGATWHMYYVAANRAKPEQLYMYHATAVSPWTAWTNRERVKGISQPFAGYMDTPSAISEYGHITLYYVGADYGLYRMTSADGITFDAPVKTNAPSGSHGRVTRVGTTYYYVFSKNPGNLYAPPTSVYLSTSSDGLRFSEPQELFIAAGNGGRVWSPQAIVDSDGLRVYYADNAGTYDWWGSNSSISVRIFK